MSLSWYMYLNPIISSFGAISNLINVIIFLNPKLKNQTYRLMLIISIANFFYLFFCAFQIISDCGDCIISKSYLSKLYDLCIGDYLSSCLAIFIIFIEITISVKRYMILSNSLRFQTIPINFIIIILFSISILFYLPVLYLKNVQEINANSTTNEMVYKLIPSEFGKSSFGKSIPIILASIRLFLATIVMSTLNILTTIKFRKRLKLKFKRNILTVSKSKLD